VDDVDGPSHLFFGDLHGGTGCRRPGT
jgi:hypothetical protein